MIGLCMVSYGLLLLVMVKVTGLPLKDLVREIPFLAWMIVILALIRHVPLTLVLPRLMNYRG